MSARGELSKYTLPSKSNMCDRLETVLSVMNHYGTEYNNSPMNITPAEWASR